MHVGDNRRVLTSNNIDTGGGGELTERTLELVVSEEAQLMLFWLQIPNLNKNLACKI